MALVAVFEKAKQLKDILGRIVRRDTDLDDRLGVMNQVFDIIPKLPADSELSRSLNDFLIKVLYESVPHPPTSYLAEDRFRQADGGRNNVHLPDMGRAGTSYARNVQGKRVLPPYFLPDSSLVFDELLKITGKPAPHPGGNSSMTFAFASLVTHSLFRTDSENWGKNNASSYLDLSPLYGSDQKEQDAVRVKDGRGLLHPDVFSESRLVFLPPASGALLVIWNRNHNYIAQNLLKINEQKKWSDPPTEKNRLVQDEEIFQTARLINCASFMSVILGDYVPGFLGLGRNGAAWDLKPFDPIMDADDGVGRAEGNHCSVEFNLLYRWHAVTSEADEKWTVRMFDKLFDKPPSEVTLPDFAQALQRLRKHQVHPDLIVDEDPRKRNFAGMERGPDGRFNDSDLADILHNATENVARRYGARGVPEVLRVIEIMGIEQGRKLGLCSMNEFRKFLGLKVFKDFEDWNPDPVIANAARRLYLHIDNLELYPGLHAEATMPLGPGSGLCAGYTITRGILSDAIALVRGDRFFTTDLTPTNLTSWGFQDVARNSENGGFGAYLPKLLMRGLPRHYTYNSIYGLFPFATPETTRTNLLNLEKQGKVRVADYDFKRPVEAPIFKPLSTLTGINHVISDVSKYKPTYGPELQYLTNGKGLLVFDEQPKNKEARKQALRALFPSKDVLTQYAEYYRKTTHTLIATKSMKFDSVPGTYIEVIGNVINIAAVRWVSEHLCGISFNHPDGEITEQDMYQMLTTMYSCIFHNNEPYIGWPLRAQAKKAADLISAKIKANIERVQHNYSGIPFLQGVADRIKHTLGLETKKPCDEFLARLAASGKPIDELVATVLGLAIGSGVNYAQAVSQAVNFYLDDKYLKERQHIIELSSRHDAESDKLLLGYYREAARLNPQLPAVVRVATAQDEIPQGGDHPAVPVKAGDRLLCSFKNAYLDPHVFPVPESVNPQRPPDSYTTVPVGTHDFLGQEFSEKTIPAVMREVFGLRNLRRAPGSWGILETLSTDVQGTEIKAYVDTKGGISPWPTSLILVYDA